MTHEAKKEYLKNQNFGSEVLRRCVKEKILGGDCFGYV